MCPTLVPGATEQLKRPPLIYHDPVRQTAPTNPNDAGLDRPIKTLTCAVFEVVPPAALETKHQSRPADFHLPNASTAKIHLQPARVADSLACWQNVIRRGL